MALLCRFLVCRVVFASFVSVWRFVVLSFVASLLCRFVVSSIVVLSSESFTKLRCRFGVSSFVVSLFFHFAVLAASCCRLLVRHFIVLIISSFRRSLCRGVVVLPIGCTTDRQKNCGDPPKSIKNGSNVSQNPFKMDTNSVQNLKKHDFV